MNIPGRVYPSAQNVPATRFTFVIPFSGEQSLFSIQPSTTLSIIPYGDVSSSAISVQYESTTKEGSGKIKIAFDSNVETIQRYLGFLADDVNIYNNSLKGIAESLLKGRKGKLDNDDDVASSFGFPIK